MDTDNKIKTTMDVEKEFLYKDLTKEILDCAFKVHNVLGCGLLEKIYENALAWDLELKELRTVSQQSFKVFYREKEVGLYYADLVVRTR